MAKSAEALKKALIKTGHPTKDVERGGIVQVKLKAPDGPPTKAWKAWRAAKAAERRPPGIE